MPKSKLRIQIGRRTDEGKVRRSNEDNHYVCFVRSEYQDRVRCLVAVADGMGGEVAGELASKMAIKALTKYFKSVNRAIDQTDDYISVAMKWAFNEANQVIYQASREDKKRERMGTTMTAAFIKYDLAVIGHVGDTRAYLIRDGKITQLTEDHSLISEQIKQEEITREEARVSPHRSVITRSIGTDPEVLPEIYSQKIKEGDGLLFCTDGLTDMVEDEEILAVIMNTKNVKQACDNLVELANKRGGHDNITVICLELGELSRRMAVREHAPTTPLKPRRIRKLLIALIAIVFLLALTIGSYLLYSKHREGVPEDKSVPQSIEDSNIGNSED